MCRSATELAFCTDPSDVTIVDVVAVTARVSAGLSAALPYCAVLRYFKGLCGSALGGGGAGG